MPLDDKEEEERIRGQLNKLALILDEGLNEGQEGEDRTYGFALLIFRFGQEGEKCDINYISNAEREDMIAAMRYYIQQNEH